MIQVSEFIDFDSSDINVWIEENPTFKIIDIKYSPFVMAKKRMWSNALVIYETVNTNK